MNRGRFVAALLAAAVVALSVAAPAWAGTGNNSANAKLCQNDGWASLDNAYTGLPFANQGACVSYGAHGNAYSSLQLTTQTYDCGNTCWASVSGSGLAPDAAVGFYAATPISGEFAAGSADSSGSIGPAQLGLSCGRDWTGVYAVSTTWAGATITSNVVSTPCG